MPSDTCEADRHLSVLVVDDNRDIADSLAIILGLGGNDVATAYDGDEAVRLLDSVPFDAVVCDLGLPGRSGYEVAAHARRSQCRTFMLAVSAYSAADAVRLALLSGFDRYLVEPADPEAIEGLLTRHATRLDVIRAGAIALAG